MSLVPILLLGRRETGHWTPAPNAISHWIWGKSALHKKGLTARHTALGFLIHHAASIFWATFHEALCMTRPQARRSNAIAISIIACFVDYQLTPRRFTPGFEHHLSKKELAVVYACFAAGLAGTRGSR